MDDFKFTLLMFVSSVACGLAISAIVQIKRIEERHKADDAKAVAAVAVLHDQEQHIAAYLKSQGAVDPAIFAAACMETSNPELCAAVALIESNCRVYSPRGAAGEIGPFQIIEGNWSWMVGKPSNDPFAAARQWDLIHAHLLEASPSLAFAIGSYNGMNNAGYVFKTWAHYKKMRP